MAANDNTKTAAYENYPNNPLSRSSKSLSITTGTAQTVAVETGGFNEMSIEVAMGGAVNGDLVVSVFPVFSDGTVSAVALTPISSTGPTFSSPKVYFFGNYDVSNQTRVMIAVKNNNASTQAALVDVQMS